MGVASVLPGTLDWYSEIDPNASRVLEHRHPDAVNLGDMTRIDWTRARAVDVLTGGTPCQDLSHAGNRAGMTDGTRSNLWVQMREAIHATRPGLVVWENVRGAYSACADSAMGRCPRCMGDTGGDHAPHLRALGRVLGDLSDLRYDAFWYGLPASAVGFAHKRFRVFVFAVPADSDHAGRIEQWRALATTPQNASAQRDGSDARGVTLLPTPNAFHMGNTETPEEWQYRRADVFARTGTRHGPALSVIAESIRQGHPLTPDAYMPNLPTPRASRGASAAETVALLPTPRASEGAHPGRTTTKPGQQRGLTEEANALASTWGAYAPAIRRAEIAVGRPAPSPTLPTGADGAPQLSAAFTEWHMGLPAGWVTDPAIWTGVKPSTARNAQLTMLGNGVVPAQVAAATRRFLEDYASTY
jgi:DNA (cytosine-5)-methyltransferase 1